MPKVYAVNVNKQGFDGIDNYGTLIAITTGMQPVFKIDKLVETIKESLADYKPEDYLILSGPNILSSLVILHLAQKFTVLNLLMRNNLTGSYVVRELNIQDI